MQQDDFMSLIDLLEDNKKFPYYAAERRIDLFLSYYIEYILTDYFNENVSFVAPEFPIKHETGNQANKADLLCNFTISKQPIIVEIKTDKESFKPSQLDKYINSTQNWPQVIEGLPKIVEKSKSDYRVKYFHLVQKLVKEGIAEYSTDNELLIKKIVKLINSSSKKDKGERSRKIIKLVNSLQAKWSGSAIVLYLAPDNTIEKVENKYKAMGNLHFLKFSDIKITKRYESNHFDRFIGFLHSIA